jgi:hypothetical protein
MNHNDFKRCTACSMRTYCDCKIPYPWTYIKYYDNNLLIIVISKKWKKI